MNRLLIKHRLLDRGWGLVDLARLTGLPYDRLIRLVNGYRCAQPDEVQAIAEALDLSPDVVLRDGHEPSQGSVAGRRDVP